MPLLRRGPLLTSDGSHLRPEMNELWSYRLGAPAVRMLPRIFSYWVALRIADQAFKRDHRGRAAVLGNLRQIFANRGVSLGEETLEGFARKTYQYFGKNIVDFFRYSHLSKRDVRRLVSLEQEEHLRTAYERGRGVIALSAHFGNWEIGGAVVATLGYPISAVVLPQRIDKVNRLYQEQRRRHGLNVIPLGRSPKSIINVLKKGECVALVADRDFSQSGRKHTFFGKPARLPRGPAWLAMKTGAAIVPCFVPRLVDDTFLFRFHPPILGDVEGSEEKVQEKICTVLEQEIAGQPNQWFVFEPFWEDGDDPAANE